MYTNTTAVLSVAPANQSLTLYDGRVVNVFSGNLYFMIQATNTTNEVHEFLECVEVSFIDYAFNYTNSLLGSNFSLLLSLNGNKFTFTSSENFTFCDFVIDASAMGELPSSPTVDSSGGFSVPSLNGNCASLPDGATVTVKGLDGDFVVEGSQFTWNDSTAQMSMIIYKLSNNGKFCLVPDVYVTAKAS